MNEPGTLGPRRYTSSDVHPIDPRLDGLTLSHVPVADVQAFKAGLRKRLNQMLRELWRPYLSLPAVPVADLILDSALNYLIARL